MSNAFDDTAKTRYRDYFEQRGLRAIPQYEVFSRSRATDLFVECNETERQALNGTVFDYFRLINAVEFKGNNDPLTASDFNLIMMRAWGIGVVDKKPKKKRKPSPFLHIKEIADLPTQRTVTIICVRRPRKVLNTLKSEFLFEATDVPGIYCDHAQKIPAWIIHPAELPLEPKYYPLLPLAYGKKLEQFIELCLKEGSLEYLRFVSDIGLITDPDTIRRKLMEVCGILFVEEQTKQAELRFLQESERARQELECVLGQKQKFLIDLLQHRFGDLPNDIAQLIKNCRDKVDLDQWLGQAFTVSSFAEIELVMKDNQPNSDPEST